MKRDDLVPLKRVADELCVSRATLWRARQSHLPDFPQPLIVRRLVYWRRGDLKRLEDALMQFQGRIQFETARAAHRKVEAIKKSAASQKRPRRARTKTRQPDLFERR